MGLDMYLTAERYVSEWRDCDIELAKKTETLGVPKTLGKVKYLVTEAAYWRKANQIHQWFVDNVQDGEDDCREYYVSIENLKELLELCKKVLANKELAEELLSVREGFFFGSYDYDDWYFQNLEDTVEQLETILSTPEDELKQYDFNYRSSW